MAEALYHAFAEVLSVSQESKDDLDALLDKEDGFAPRLRQICQDEIADLQASMAPQSEIEHMQLEANTWALLQLILPPRKIEPTPKPTAHDLLAQNPYTPPATLVQALMDSSELLSELVVVREWLQDTAPPVHHPEANTGYWKFTKHNILQGLRTTNSYRDGLVKELDPDAPNREDGRGLASEDASYERSLLQALYGCVRAGRLDEAVEICRKAHQPWRASSILGARLFSWPSISLEPTDEDAMVEDDEEVWSGNQRRDLWKNTCTRMALDPKMPEQERILYAALAPSSTTATLLKANCKTWEDHLWVQTSIICEDKTTTDLRHIGGRFWENDGAEEGPNGLPDNESWQREVLESLHNLKDVPVTEGPGADHAYHWAQLHIILNRTDALLNKFAGGLKDDVFQRKDFESAQSCRFFAHLCLFLQLVDIPTPPLATQTILESYLQVLEESGQRELIAMYASALGENAVERYAMYLVSLGLSADLSQRKLALAQAREHGLDTDRVAVVSAERTIEYAFRALPAPSGPLPSLTTLEPEPSTDDLLLLRSIEWTTFDEASYATALEQTNVILRYFLGMGRPRFAVSLLDLLPAELSEISEPEERATEYLHYRQFFVIWERLEQVVECHARSLQPMGKDAKARWIEEYKALIDNVHEQIVQLLTTEWLVTDAAKIGDRRSRDLQRIRQIYIPELVIRLHFTLLNSREWIPDNLKRALQLANVVADSRYKLYEDFVNENGKRLGEYLEAVRLAFIAGLDKGGSDPFRLVSSI